ncbi:hypothetical protein IAT38_003981 [Cryptococcus sp. DSM 104549]
MGEVCDILFKAIEDLDVVHFSELFCPRRHTDRMVVGRVLTKPVIGVGVTFHLEDPTGLVLPVHIEFPLIVPGHGPEISQELYPIDTILVIREPLLRYGLKGGYVLVVEAAMDIVEIPATAVVLKDVSWASNPIKNLSWEDYKTLGNEDLKNGSPLIALRRYTTGLRAVDALKDPYSQFILHLNSAQACLALHRYASAYTAASTAQRLASDNSLPLTAAQHSRVLWRLANAAYGLRLYDIATKLAQDCKAIPVLAKSVPLFMRKIAARKAERDEGRYDWNAMLDATHSSTTPSLDVSDFTGSVEARATGNGGRGLFLTRDVKQSELLMVSKAIVCSWPAHGDKLASAVVDQERTVSVPQDVVSAVQRLVCTLREDPTVEIVLDGLPTSKNPHPAQIPDLTSIPDQGRIIVCWGGNVTNNAFGDVLVLRAARDMSQGTELLLPLSPRELKNRTACLPALFDTCACPLCKADQTDDWETRVEILRELVTTVSTSLNAPGQVGAIMNLAVRLAATYGDREEWLKPELGEAWSLVASCASYDWSMAGHPIPQE